MLGRRDRGRARKVLVGTSLVAVVAVVAILAVIGSRILANRANPADRGDATDHRNYANRGNPDPGGRRLAALTSIAGVLPSRAHVIVHNVVEPHWDSCDGRAGTFGWDDVSVEYEFTTGQRPAEYLSHAVEELSAQGWKLATPEQQPDYFVMGTRGSGSAMLHVDVSAGRTSPGGPVTWNLGAWAPPVGHQASGC